MRVVVLTLRAADRPLSATYDVAMLDLDGVVYIGGDAVPGAPQALARARADGIHLAFVTNNAARPPDVVARHLTDLGIVAQPDEVITSSQAAARHLADRLPVGSRVLVLGTTGLEQALRERDLVPVSSAEDDPAAVVQGYSPDTDWRLLAEGAVAINRGLPWVATNVDPTVPSARGPLPGNGSLVAALRLATMATPVVTGKPEPTMHRETVIRTGARRPIVVGDRLDTDIEGANAVGCASLLVFSGVTTPAELLAAAPRRRPDFLAADVGGLLHAHPAPHVTRDAASCGSWRVSDVPVGRAGSDGAEATGIELTRLDETGSAAPPSQDGAAAPTGDGKDWDALRALCAWTWSVADRRGGVSGGGVSGGGVLSDVALPRIVAGDRAATQALSALGLGDG